MDSKELKLPNLAARHSLRDAALESLRAALVTGQLKPGELYSVPKLAEQFGVSATPVREAMFDLVAEGHFDVERNKGFRVRFMSDKDLNELAELRGFCEPPAMAAVAQRAAEDSKVARQIERLLPKAEKIVLLAEKKDLLGYLEADTEFHTAYLSLLGNDLLVNTIRDLRTRSRLFGLERLAAAGTLPRMAAEHIQMVQAGSSGDAEKLHQLTQQHLAHVRREWAGS